MDEDVNEQLSTPESEFHKQMLKESLDLLKMSRSKMVKKYADWDLFQQVYKGERTMDNKDIQARERKEPEKMVVPLTFAQIQAFISFCFSIYTQRDRFFELVGSGVEDWKPAKIAEALLQRDLNHNQWNVHLYQLLLNISRFGLGVIEHSWTKETQMQWVNAPQPATPDLGGVAMNFQTPQMALQEVVSYLGNRIETVSPYRFFPDPRMPIGRLQEGEFCASECDVSPIWLKKMQRWGMLTGCDKVPDMASNAWEWRLDNGMRSDVTYDRANGKQKGGVIFTKLQREIIPKDYKLDSGKPLGPEDYPIKYIICIANDSRVLKCEPLNYLHNKFTYDAAQLHPDEMISLNAGIAETINELQSVITWLFNSRITNVRKIIQDRMVVDPEGVNMADVADRKSVIRLKPGASRSGVERWISQLSTQDVTQGHIDDATALGQIMQLVTGINDNASGQYSSGRRSAEQTRAVNSGAAGRLKMYASLIWTQAIQPLGEKMLSNLRDGLDVEQMVRVMGLQLAQPQSPYAVGLKDASQFLGVTKADLIGNYDFEVQDGTLPTEKTQTAQLLQEILIQILSNPQAAAVLGLDAKALMTEIAELNNVRNPERFFLQPPVQGALMQAAQQTGQPQLGQPAGSAALTDSTIPAMQGAPTAAPALPSLNLGAS